MNTRQEFQQHFSNGGISRHWLLVRTPLEILSMKSVQIANLTAVSGKSSIKQVFQELGFVTNRSDGRVVRFPGKSVGKMLGQCGVDLGAIAAAFGILFEQSLLAWSEPELLIPGHKVHPDVMAYHQYVVRFNWENEAFFARFTVRESRSTPKSRNDVHAATISRVTLYKTEGATSTDLGQNQVEDTAPFTDNKLSFFFGAVNGVAAGAINTRATGKNPGETFQQ